MRDITLEDTIYPKFTTRAFATGIPTVLAGSPVVSVYENENLTQITAGVTLGVDHDSVVGLNMITIAATAANGYEAGKEYAAVITTGTVGGVSVVGEVVAEFTIASAAAAVDLANGTDGLGAIKGDTAATLLDTAEIGAAGAGLTAINLPNQTMDITGNITGNLSGSVGSVTGAVGSVTGAVGSVTGAVGSVAGNVDGNVTGSVGSNLELGPAEVNAEVVDVMKTDTLTATPQAAPPTSPTFEEAVMVLYDALVHAVDVTATSKEFKNNGGTVIWKKALSDDATTYTEAESASGP